jgi:hypothetical protein
VSVRRNRSGKQALDQERKELQQTVRYDESATSFISSDVQGLRLNLLSSFLRWKGIVCPMMLSRFGGGERSRAPR